MRSQISQLDEDCSQAKRTDCQHRAKMKVELCRNFIAMNSCPYGSKCRFAHGLKELLQNSELNSNFRTKNCKAFYVGGECKYGDRCNFKHDDRKLCDIHRQTQICQYDMMQRYPDLLTSVAKKPLFLFSVEPAETEEL